MDLLELRDRNGAAHFPQSPDGAMLDELHVVMVPYPLQGHINPMMQLAKLLIAQHACVRITFVNNKHNHDCILSKRHVEAHSAHTKSDAATFGSPVRGRRTGEEEGEGGGGRSRQQLQFEWVDNGLPPDFDYSDIVTQKEEYHAATYNMKDPLKLLLQKLNQKEAPCPVSCVVFGCFCSWAHTAASELGIPSIMLWTQSTAVLSMYCHVPLLDANGFFPFNKKSLSGCKEEGKEQLSDPDDQKVVSYIPGIPALHPTSFPTLLHADTTSDPSVASVNEQVATLGSCSGVIINSFEELEREAYQALQEKLPCSLCLVGPLIPSAFLNVGDMNDTNIGASLLQESKDCIEWLDSQEAHSVLYISFGSLFNISAEDQNSLACAIQARKQPFLWVIRSPSSVENLEGLLRKGLREDTKDYGLIIPWAPQLQVLSHPSIGAFLTHCGWNSTMESMSMGVPMIPFPLMSDQPTNCTYVCDIWKIGMAIKRQGNGKVKDENIEEVIRVLFEEEGGKGMRTRASTLREAAQRAVLVQGSSSMHMQRLMKVMRSERVSVARQ